MSRKNKPFVAPMEYTLYGDFLDLMKNTKYKVIPYKDIPTGGNVSLLHTGTMLWEVHIYGKQSHYQIGLWGINVEKHPDLGWLVYGRKFYGRMSKRALYTFLDNITETQS